MHVSSTWSLEILDFWEVETEGEERRGLLRKCAKNSNLSHL